MVYAAFSQHVIDHGVAVLGGLVGRPSQAAVFFPISASARIAGLFSECRVVADFALQLFVIAVYFLFERDFDGPANLVHGARKSPGKNVHSVSDVPRSRKLAQTDAMLRPATLPF